MFSTLASFVCLCAVTHLFSNNSLFDSRQVLQRSQQEMCICRPTEVIHKRAAELLRKRHEHLILVIQAILQERDQLVPRPFRAERERDRREPVDRIEAQVHIVRFELVDEHGDGVKLLIGLHLGRTEGLEGGLMR